MQRKQTWSLFPRKSTEDPEFSAAETIVNKRRKDQLIKEFLSSLSGKQVSDDAPLSGHQTAFIKYIETQLTQYSSRVLLDIIRGPEAQIRTFLDLDESFNLLKCIAQEIQKESQFSLERLLRQCVQNQTLCQAALDAPLRNKALSVLFTCVGWISMLYPPKANDLASEKQPMYESMTIDKSQCFCIVDSQPLSVSSRPLCEIMQDFGQLLPVRGDDLVPKTAVRRDDNSLNTAESLFSADSLYVSQLNASALTQIGGIKLKWVSNISSHLVFDPEVPVLLLFSLPSFCEISQENTSLLANVLATYYDEYNKPPGFSTPAFLKEIRRSYRLLFSDDRRAYKHYMKHERRGLLSQNALDPYLDELCKPIRHKTANPRRSYSKATDFPIFARRLSIIQDFIQRTNPDTIGMLWKDKRNLLQWYTFWALTIIGSLGIVLSAVQTGLSAAQVYYARSSVQEGVS